MVLLLHVVYSIQYLQLYNSTIYNSKQYQVLLFRDNKGLNVFFYHQGFNIDNYWQNYSINNYLQIIIPQ